MSGERVRPNGLRWRALLAAALVCGGVSRAQEMQPRAYLPSPVGVGFAGVAYGYSAGQLLFDPSLPVEDGSVRAQTPSLSVGGSFATLGRSSQVLAVLPYVTANLSGKLAGVEESRYRSGLADLTLRYAINLRGAPSMTRQEFAKRRPREIIGVSITATVPSGQYDRNRLLNVGTNRWAFKPEVGAAWHSKQWTFEGAFGVWVYGENSQFLGSSRRTQRPLWSTQAHIVRVMKRKHWLAGDFTYFKGGRVEVDGRPAATYQANTRLGATYGYLITPRQSLRVSYFSGVTTRIGGDIQSIGVAYQFLWAAGR